MANPAAIKVVAAKPVATGGVLAAPTGTALPTTVVAALNVAFLALGYVSEDGMTKSENRDSSEIKDWAGLTVKKSQTSFEATFQFQFLEYLNSEAAKTIYGSSAVTVTAATVSTGERLAIAVSGAEAPHKSWVFEMANGVAKIRIVVPDGQITEVGDTAYTSDGAAVRDVTITAFPDASGNSFYEYTDDGTFA